MVRAFITAIFFIWASCLQAQNKAPDFNITNVYLNNEQVHVYLNIKNQNQRQIHAYNLQVEEKIDSINKLEIISIDELKEGDISQQLTILFLIDVSGSMKKHNRIGLARAAVEEAINNVNVPANTSILLATFHDDASDNYPINKENVKQVIKEQIIIGRDTDLYNTLIQKTNY